MEIIITGQSASLEESRKAREVPLGELPRLTDEQKEVAKKFGISEEDNARQVVALQYGEARLRAGATKLGQVIEKQLPELVQGV